MTNASATCRRRIPALESPDLDITPQFQTFLDVFGEPGLALQADERDRDGGPGPRRSLRRGLAGGRRHRPAGAVSSRLAQQIDDELAAGERPERVPAASRRRRAPRRGADRPPAAPGASAVPCAAVRRRRAVHVAVDHRVPRVHRLPDVREPVLQLHELRPALRAEARRAGELPFMFTKDPQFWQAMRNTLWIIAGRPPARDRVRAAHGDAADAAAARAPGLPDDLLPADARARRSRRRSRSCSSSTHRSGP